MLVKVPFLKGKLIEISYIIDDCWELLYGFQKQSLLISISLLYVLVKHLRIFNIIGTRWDDFVSVFNEYYYLHQYQADKAFVPTNASIVVTTK